MSILTHTVCVRVTAAVVVVGSVCDTIRHVYLFWYICIKRGEKIHAHTQHTSIQIRMKISTRYDDDRLKCFQSENIRVDCCWRTFLCRICIV